MLFAVPTEILITVIVVIIVVATAVVIGAQISSTKMNEDFENDETLKKLKI